MHTVVKIELPTNEIIYNVSSYNNGWNTIKSFKREEDAFYLCNYLNGGNGIYHYCPPVEENN